MTERYSHPGQNTLRKAVKILEKLLSKGKILEFPEVATSRQKITVDKIPGCVKSKVNKCRLKF
jgi:hypothetical protein